jgi:hypothetical protein
VTGTATFFEEEGCCGHCKHPIALTPYCFLFIIQVVAILLGNLSMCNKKQDFLSIFYFHGTYTERNGEMLRGIPFVSVIHTHTHTHIVTFPNHNHYFLLLFSLSLSLSSISSD